MTAKTLISTVFVMIVSGPAFAQTVVELKDFLSPNCQVEYLSQYGNDISIYSRPCAYEMERARWKMKHLSAKVEQLKDVPASEVAEVRGDFESEGATTTVTRQMNGKFTVTATFLAQ